MRKSLPCVYISSKSKQPGQLHYRRGGRSELTSLNLNDPAWLKWLGQAHSFRVISWQYGGQVEYNVLPDKRKGTKTRYWSAWKSVRGKTKKFYLGPPHKVTKGKLDQAGAYFLEALNRNTADLIDVPVGWEALTSSQKAQVEAFIRTLLWPEG
jgi:hypothetical protein